MAERTEVVCINIGKKKNPARPEGESHRMIFSIAGQRYALDLFSRVCTLPPLAENPVVTVLPMTQKSDWPRNRKSKSRLRLDS
jgi:hypothetical protein